MVPYQVVIEGVFVRIGADSEALGFHSTFYVFAGSASNAVHRTRDLVAKRMHAHHVVEAGSSRLFQPHYLVHDIWEITEKKFEENEHRDSGFTFFRIRSFEKLQLAVRHMFIKRTKPWRLLSLPSG